MGGITWSYHPSESSTPTTRSKASSGWLSEQAPALSRVNPPWNHPQVTSAAVRRSPMFRPDRAAVWPLEQTSQYGSVSSTNVPNWPLGGTAVDVDEAGGPHSDTCPYTDDEGPHSTP